MTFILESRLSQLFFITARFSFIWPSNWNKNETISVNKIWYGIKITLAINSAKRYLGRVKWIWYLSPMRAAKVQASMRIRAVSPEPPLLAHTSSESRGTFRQKAKSLAPMNGWACAVKICHDWMLEDTNSLDAAHLKASLALITSLSSSHEQQCTDHISVV